MYLEHFGLDRSPFKITPDTSLFYEGGNRGAALEAVKYAILQGEGIIKVVGEVGSGKTMLCRMLELKLPSYVEIVYLANPSLSPEKILHVIATEMKLSVEQTDDKAKVMQQLQECLLDRHARGRQVVVFIEEAQGMPLETLEEIRLLSNLETEQFKMLQIVLFGQPELDENLAQRQIRQLRERITHHLSLDMFEKKDIQSYLNFRLRAAGYKEADLFNARLAGKIAKYSKGLTRRINIIADKALLAAYSENSQQIKPKHIKMAANDSQYATVSLPAWAKYMALALVVVLLLAAGWFGRDLGQTLAIADNSQVKTDENAASSGNKSTFSTHINGKSEKQQLHSEDLSDLLQQRLKAGLSWLNNTQGYRYSVQLLLIDETRLTALDAFLEKMQKNNFIDNAFVYQARKDGKRYFGVMYGGFKQYSNASQSMKQISKKLKVKSPFIRDMETITTDYS